MNNQDLIRFLWSRNGFHHPFNWTSFVQMIQTAPVYKSRLSHFSMICRTIKTITGSIWQIQSGVKTLSIEFLPFCHRLIHMPDITAKGILLLKINKKSTMQKLSFWPSYYYYKIYRILRFISSDKGKKKRPHGTAT